jgi:hypothetical protein
MSRETRRQIEFLRADIGTLKSMLAERAGESMAARLSRFGLEQRLIVASAELAELEALAGQEPERAHVEMTFRGAAVVGSEGIEANFAGVVAQQYPSLVRAMRRKNFPRKRGTAHQPSEPRLLLTGTARGSFGLVFDEEAIETGDEAETPLHNASEQVAELLEEVAIAAAPLEVFLGLPATVQKPLKGLLSACKEAGVSMRVSSVRVERGWRELSAAQIEAAAAVIGELRGGETRTRDVSGQVAALNTLVKPTSFVFLADGEPIAGVWGGAQEEAEAVRLLREYGGKTCWARIATTEFERRGVREGRHVLLGLASSKEELVSEEEEG